MGPWNTHTLIYSQSPQTSEGLHENLCCTDAIYLKHTLITLDIHKHSWYLGYFIWRANKSWRSGQSQEFSSTWIWSWSGQTKAHNALQVRLNEREPDHAGSQLNTLTWDTFDLSISVMTTCVPYFCRLFKIRTSEVNHLKHYAAFMFLMNWPYRLVK